MTKYFLNLAFTCAALWLALRNVAWEDLKQAFLTQNRFYFFAALLGIGGQLFAGALRWYAIRRAIEPQLPVGMRQTVTMYYASNFFNICLPSTLGSDAARVWLLKKAGSSMKNVLYGVALDRVMSLVGLCALVATTLPVLSSYIELRQDIAIVAGVAFWIALVAGFALLHRLLPLLGALLRFAWVSHIITAIEHTKMHWPLMFASLLWAMFGHILHTATAYLLAAGLHIDISLLACLVLIPLVMFIATLPISLGGWGVREVSMVHILALAGVESTQALVLSLQLGAITMLASIMSGGVYLLIKPRQSAEVSPKDNEAMRR
ncbi:MAG: lysylphosphatidylglycerol synthase transmembrane domain-containing protein [Alphaproteobacteria bacterium]|nr:lysylphosphatidylglycerol synthase transmembrane domain-containing protein [Alphaproteobacteria bacterium]